MKSKTFFLKKQKNLKFFYSLINSDFLILEKNYNKKENRYLKSNLKLLNKKKNLFSLLNYFELIKMLKQFIRILQFFKNSKNPLFFLDSNNKQFSKIITFFTEKYDFILPIQLKKNSLFENKASAFILSVDKNVLDYKNNLKKLVYSNIFIIIQINSFLKNLNNGSYKIFNTFDTLKKLIFLLVLVKKIYIKKSKKNSCV
jgi:hypothetical protein